jgi:hypothetical protein
MAYHVIWAVLPHITQIKYGQIILLNSSAVFDGEGDAIVYAVANPA